MLEWARSVENTPYPYSPSELRAPLLPDSARTVAGTLPSEAHPAAGLVLRAWMVMGIMPSMHRPPNLAMSKVGRWRATDSARGRCSSRADPLRRTAAALPPPRAQDFTPRAFAETVDGVRMKPPLGVRQSLV